MRRSAASHSAPARRSIQISAGPTGSPSAPAATIPSSCEPNEIARRGRLPTARRTSASAWATAPSHSRASCSAQPGWG